MARPSRPPLAGRSLQARCARESRGAEIGRGSDLRLRRVPSWLGAEAGFRGALLRAAGAGRLCKAGRGTARRQDCAV